jgi:hypothetical protein
MEVFWHGETTLLSRRVREIGLDLSRWKGVFRDNPKPARVTEHQRVKPNQSSMEENAMQKRQERQTRRGSARRDSERSIGRLKVKTLNTNR